MRAALVGIVVLLLAAPASRAGVTDEDIQAAIDRGVEALLKEQNEHGWWSDRGVQRRWFTWQGGWEAYAMLALAYADVPLSNPKMRKGFDALLEFKMGHTYNAAARIMVLSKLMPKLGREDAERARKVMLDDVTFLVRTQRTTGGWEYPHEDYFSKDPPAKRINQDYWDFSNTQMAVLGLSEAINAGVEVPRETMLRVQNLYLEWQNPDGGWNYGRPTEEGNRTNPSYGSMSAAAVASLFITRDYLFPGVGCPCRGGRSQGKVPKVDKAIDDGLAWLGKNFAPDRNPPRKPEKKGENWIRYWLYSAERVGLASGVKYFGGHDWYAEGAEWLLRDQNRRTGLWGHPYETAYAICFLVKGRAPILFNKLHFKGEWNSHPRDMANLVKVIGKRKEQPMQWQIINLQAPVAEWHDAPILYITAESPLVLTADEKKKLREFTDTGGTILFEASCGHPGAKRSWEMVLREVWPEFELQAVSREHPLWTADLKITGRLPKLLGMSDGVRTFMFVAWRDISCPWHTMAVAADQVLFDMGSNMYVYATDRRPLRARLATKRVMASGSYLDARLKAGKRAAVTVARVRGGGDWYVGQNYHLLDRLASSVAERFAASAAAKAAAAAAAKPEKGKATEPAAEKAEKAISAGLPVKLTVKSAAPPSELKAAGIDIAYLTGRKTVRLADDEAAALSAMLSAGTFLLAEAALGDPEADAQMRQLLAGPLGLELRPIAESDPLVTGKFDGAAGYDVGKVRFKFALREERIGKLRPELVGLYRDGRLVGVYSPFDLLYAETGMDAFGSRGYEDEDALAILTNILLLVSTR